MISPLVPSGCPGGASPRSISSLLGRAKQKQIRPVLKQQPHRRSSSRGLALTSGNGVGTLPSPLTPGPEPRLAASTRLCPPERAWLCARSAPALGGLTPAAVRVCGQLVAPFPLRPGVYETATTLNYGVRVPRDCLQAGVTGNSLWWGHRRPGCSRIQW